MRKKERRRSRGRRREVNRYHYYWDYYLNDIYRSRRNWPSEPVSPEVPVVHNNNAELQ